MRRRESLRRLWLRRLRGLLAMDGSGLDPYLLECRTAPRKLLRRTKGVILLWKETVSKKLNAPYRAGPGENVDQSQESEGPYRKPNRS